MSRGFTSELEDIRQENTQYALFFINKTPELLDKYLKLKSMRLNNKDKSVNGIKIANEWAEEHKNEFGDLFQTELELVRWNKVLKLL